MLVEFDQHATGLHVVGHPHTDAIVDHTSAAAIVPPATCPASGFSAVATVRVVVAVYSREHHSVDDIAIVAMNHKSIAGVTAVPIHRQPILTDLITDGERRVLSPVPLTVSTILTDLITDEERRVLSPVPLTVS